VCQLLPLPPYHQPACRVLLLLLLLSRSVPDSEPVVIAPAAPVSSISSTHTIASVTCTQQPERHELKLVAAGIRAEAAA
jgi:hypothetical protein